MFYILFELTGYLPYIIPFLFKSIASFPISKLNES